MKHMKSAPTDRPIVLHMPDGSKFEAFLDYFEDGGDRTVGGWVAKNESDAPEDWSEGICWAQNWDGVASTRPVGWSEVDPR